VLLKWLAIKSLLIKTVAGHQLHSDVKQASASAAVPSHDRLISLINIPQFFVEVSCITDAAAGGYCVPNWQLGLSLCSTSQHAACAFMASADQLRQVHVLQQPLLQQQQQQQQQQGGLQQACHASFCSSTAPAPKVPTKHERRVASLKFCQERSLWRAQLKQLRKHWMLEHQQKVAAHR